MRKTILSMTTAILCISALSGCQKAPEASDDQDIPHALSTLEQQISEIVGENAEEKPQQQSSPRVVYEGTIGTTDNKMKINAQIPAIPANVYQITLVPNDDLDRDALTALLDSSSGNIEDTSQELLNRIEKSDYDNTHGDELTVYSKFGDHSALQLTDREKEASFTCHTGVYYVNHNLYDTYLRNAQGASTIIPISQPDAGAVFSVKEAEQILLDKLDPLGITEIALQRIVLTEDSGYSYYELDFVPSYEGISMIRELGGGYGLGELYPNGSAIVTPEGTAFLNLANFCGKIADKEPVTVLSFKQVIKILEQYLDSNSIQGDARLMLSDVALEYYPVPNLTPTEREIEYRSELVLIPIWHIYMPLDDYMDAAGYECNGFHNICINAITGEIERVN